MSIQPTDWSIVGQGQCITELVEVEVRKLGALLLMLKHIFGEPQRIWISKCRLNRLVNHYQRPSQQIPGVYERHMWKVGWEVSGGAGQWDHANSRSDRYNIQPR